MNREKLSVSISPSLAKFVESYRAVHALPSKSAVVAGALEALRDGELQQSNAEASRDADSAW